MSVFHWTAGDFLQASYVCLTALSILVTAFMAVWVVKSVQSKIDNERMLRDHFAREIIDLRKDVRCFLKEIVLGKVKAQEIKRRHFRLGIHIKDILDILNARYKIDKKSLKAYRTNLLKILESDGNYTNAFQPNNKVNLEEKTVKKLHKLELENDHLFNVILMKIYEQRD